MLRWPLQAHVEAVAWSHCGTRFAFALADGRLCSGMLPGNPGLREVVTGAAQIHHVWAAAGGDAWWCTTDRQDLLLVCDDSTPRVVAHLDSGAGEQVALARDGRFAVAAGRQAVVFDPEGARTMHFGSHPSTVAGLAFSPDGRRLAAAHYMGVSVHDTANPTAPARRLSYGGSHLGIAWSPDGSFLATGTQDKEVHVWRVADGTDMRMSGYYAKVRALSWSSDGAWLVTSGGDAAVGWAFDGGGPEGRPPRMVSPMSEALVTIVQCHPTLPLVAIGHSDGGIVLSALGNRPLDVVLERACGSATTAIAWSADGRQLLGGCASGRAFVAPMDL